jgi:dsRNA-specific ribonuclease
MAYIHNPQESVQDWGRSYQRFRSNNESQVWFENQKQSFIRDELPIERLVRLRKVEKWNNFESKEFKELIKNLLKSGGVSDDLLNESREVAVSKKYRAYLLDDSGMTYFKTSFTHVTEDSNNNYETLEFLGDLTFNKCVGWYLPRRYPQLYSPEATEILTKLKIFIIQSKQMGALAEKSGFLKFIRYDPSSIDFKKTNTQKILEDVFEACFGAIESVLDTKIKIGVGYTVCYNIIKKILDSENYSLRFEDLVDPITHLKEIFDKFRFLGTIMYMTIKESAPIFHIKIKQTMPDGRTRIIAEAKNAGDLSTAKQLAAEQALSLLGQEGVSHPDKGKFQKFCSLSI